MISKGGRYNSANLLCFEAIGEEVLAEALEDELSSVQMADESRWLNIPPRAIFENGER